MATRFDDWEGDFLAHFGTKGMKWGQRRYQNEDGSLTPLGQQRYGDGNTRGRLGIKHDLNKLDREQAQAKVRAEHYRSKTIRKNAKIERSLEKAKASNDHEKISKLAAKQQKVNQTVAKKARKYSELLENSKKMTNRIIQNATRKGYSIKSRECARSVNKGRNAVLNILGGAAGAVTGVGVVTAQVTSGKHYRVRKDGLGTVTHRSSRRITAAHSSRRG